MHRYHSFRHVIPPKKISHCRWRPDRLWQDPPGYCNWLGISMLPILSADSRQFYREMRIGTARPDPDEELTRPHTILLPIVQFASP